MRRVFESVMVNKDEYAISRAMIKAGYSPAMAKNPQKLPATDTWKALLEEYFPDRYLAEKHRKLVESKNELIALQSVTLAYKVKGRLSPESINNIGEVNFNFGEPDNGTNN